MPAFRWCISAVLALATSPLAFSAETPPALPDAPARLRWEVEFESGVLWKVGGGATPLSYTLLPQIISFKIPPITERPWAGGTFVFRSRFSLLLEPIVRGPESYYVGAAAAGEIEWRSKYERFTGFFSSGGGFGWMDSQGYEMPGGQGQDFNLNWLIHAGVRFRTAHDWRVSVGLYFQHISNRGMDKINPGLNALGPTLGLSRKF
ncbi:acyloxyacyl hydrolase [Oleiharenicola lentus]|uniref:acyloxyacyl hydrolase n=1 Tax=Oleiharenicola lentus TaxID=2508720 RepID=UPI003F680D85